MWNRARIVGEQEADAGDLEEVLVDRLELVGQRIDAGDGEREIGVVLVGEPEAVPLDAQPEPEGVPVERSFLGADRELRDLLGVKHRLMGQVGAKPASDQLQRASHGDGGEHLDGFGEEGAGHDGASNKVFNSSRHARPPLAHHRTAGTAVGRCSSGR